MSGVAAGGAGSGASSGSCAVTEPRVATIPCVAADIAHAKKVTLYNNIYDIRRGTWYLFTGGGCTPSLQST